MAKISEVEDRIYEIRPEGTGLNRFPFSTVYIVADDKTALIEAGCPVQIPDILAAIGKLGYDANELSYVIPTHMHADHAGGVGLLTRKLPQLKVVTHPRTAELLSDSEMISRLMQGFRNVFEDNAQDRFGAMLPVPQEKFVMVEDGDSISLGERTLKVIHTSGHEPYHLSFLDTRSRGLFCGDALGAHISEIEVIISFPVVGSDLVLLQQSIKKLRELDPAILLFSHGGATREVVKLFQLAENDARQCPDIALKALRAGVGRKEVAHRLLDVFSQGSALARADLLDWPLLIPIIVEGYRQYFKKKKMI
jgi:glyoxylase-like metal-dependent hydrolase (beta-lactamase superfamily II)